MVKKYFKYETAKISANILILCSFLVLVLARWIMSTGKVIDKHLTLEKFGYPDQLKVVSWVLAGFAVITFIFTLNLRILLHKGLPVLTINILIVALIAFITVGQNVVVPYGLDESTVEENCKLVNQNRTNEIQSDDPFVREMFQKVSKHDRELFVGLNMNMCTQTCPCDNSDNSSLSYDRLPETTYEQFGRTKNSSENNTTNLTDFQWDSMVASHKSAISCLDHLMDIKKGVDDYTQPTVPFTDYRITWGKDAINYMGSNALDKLETIDKNLKPDLRDKIAFIEGTYNCSGACKAPFFYITQSIEKGPPEHTCLQALFTDVAAKLGYYQSLVYGTANFYVLMIFCCFIILFSEPSVSYYPLNDDETELRGQAKHNKSQKRSNATLGRGLHYQRDENYS